MSGIAMLINSFFCRLQLRLQMNKPGQLPGLAIVSLLIVASFWSAAAVATDNDRALLWSLSRGGEPAGYLLGTIHSEDPRVLDFEETFLEQLASCQIFAMEMVPDILLVDEVLGVGDQSFRIKSTSSMKQKMKAGQTAVFVSHNLQQVADICSRVCWMDRGRVRMLGTPSDVIAAYSAAKR